MVAVDVTHPQVVIDHSVAVPDWGLWPEGRARAERETRQPWARSLTRIGASTERKARERADILGGAAGLEPELLPDMHESDRSTTDFRPGGEFEAAADKFLAKPFESFRGWETAEAAQARIQWAVESALDGHPDDRPVAFVRHGAVGTLLWLALMGRPIDRVADKPQGGGYLVAFGLGDRRPLLGWQPFESWDGVAALAERNVND